MHVLLAPMAKCVWRVSSLFSRQPDNSKVYWMSVLQIEQAIQRHIDVSLQLTNQPPVNRLEILILSIVGCDLCFRVCGCCRCECICTVYSFACIQNKACCPHKLNVSILPCWTVENGSRWSKEIMSMGRSCSSKMKLKRKSSHLIKKPLIHINYPITPLQTHEFILYYGAVKCRRNDHLAFAAPIPSMKCFHEILW